MKSKSGEWRSLLASRRGQLYGLRAAGGHGVMGTGVSSWGSPLSGLKLRAGGAIPE